MNFIGLYWSWYIWRLMFKLDVCNWAILPDPNNALHVLIRNHIPLRLFDNHTNSCSLWLIILLSHVITVNTSTRHTGQIKKLHTLEYFLHTIGMQLDFIRVMIYVTVVLDCKEKSKSKEVAFVRARIRAVLQTLHSKWSSNG